MGGAHCPNLRFGFNHAPPRTPKEETDQEMNLQNQQTVPDTVSLPTTDTPPTNPRSDTPLVLGICVVFLIPAIVLLMLAWPCLDYGFTTQHRYRVSFFVFGGHAILMVALLLAAVTITFRRTRESRTPASCVGMGLAIIYLPTVIVCWLMVALGVVSWTCALGIVSRLTGSPHANADEP